MRRMQLSGVSCGLIALSVFAAGPTHAAFYTVTGFADNTNSVPLSGAGTAVSPFQMSSLRGAVIAANNSAGPDTITLLSGTYTLTLTGSDNTCLGGDLDINDSLTINGVSSAATTIRMTPPGPAGDYKVIGVNQDGTHPNLTVSINNVTITGGRNDTPSTGTFQETGGGVDFYLTGTACNYSMSNCIITGNSATGSAQSHGGGVNVDSTGSATAGGPSVGTVMFSNCTFSNNFSDREGGGLGLFADKHDVTLTNCTITGNHTNVVGGNGGGLYVAHSYGGTVTINGGLVQNNTSAAGGGGIAIGANGNVSASNLTISGNTSSGVSTANSIGGGVAIIETGAAGISSTIGFTGCTISGNHADGANLGQGGGIYAQSAYPTTLTNCTISGNTARTGAGAYNGGATATPIPLTINSSSVTGNSASAIGGGVAGNGSLTLSKCTITGNSAVTGGGGLAMLPGGVAGSTLNASFCRIVSNTGAAPIGLAHTGGTALVENNWWGTNTPAGVVTGAADFNPWLKLNVTAGAPSLAMGSATAITADFTRNSDNTVIATANLTALIGLPVSFGATLGTISGAATNIGAAATAGATFTAGNTAGAGSASATVDGFTTTAPITVVCPTINASVTGGGTVCAGSTSQVIVTITSGQPPFTVTLNNGGGTLIGSSPLTFNLSPGATTTYAISGGSDGRGCALTPSGSATVNVVSIPAAPTAPTATPTIVCPGHSSVLSATVPAGQTVDWFTGSCGGTPVAGGATPTVSPAASTTYFARARTTTGSCVSTTCVSVRVVVCAADVNCSGSVTVQDIFDFLAAYFSNNAAIGDFNHSGGISVQDIFDFLAAYFAGCA